MSRPLVSVVVTFKDAGPYVADLVRSVFAQTMSDWELLLLDDGSKDAGCERLLAVSDSRVRIMSDGQWKGTAIRLNELTHQSRGKYLAVMGADDVMHPSRLELQVADLELTGADVTGGGMYTMNDDNEITGIMHPPPVPGRRQDVVRRGLLFHGASMGTRDWFLVNQYDPSFVRAQDRELWCRTFEASRFSVVNEPIIYYRMPLGLDLAKYRRSCVANRRIVRKYGPAHGNVFLMGELLRSYAKEALFIGAVAVSLEERLVARRTGVLDPNDLRAAQETLVAVQATHVPGWDEE